MSTPPLFSVRKSLYLSILTLLIGVIFSACSQDAPNLAEQKQNEYLVNWIKKIGLIDESQTWNVAAPVLAEVTPARYGNDVTIYIYSSNPASGGKLIGQTSTNKTLHLDVLKNRTSVFVQAIDSKGCCYENTYYPIVGGKVSINNSRSYSRAASDLSLGSSVSFAEGANRQEYREDYDASNPYTLEEAISLKDKKYLWKTNLSKEYDQWGGLTSIDVTFVDIFGTEYNYHLTNDGSATINVYNFPIPDGFSAYGGFTDDELEGMPFRKDYNKRLVTAPSPAITYQRINGIETTTDKTVAIKDLNTLFGKNGYFEEQRTPSCLEKYKNDFNPDVTFVVSGPLTLDYMYGATQNRNVFGYYYWQEGEDPITATRYILIDDARPQSNIQVDDTYLSDGMQLSGIMVAGNPAESESILRGTSYKVPYFDEDGNASYDFPNGTHVAFFLIVNGYNNMSSDQTSVEGSWLGNTNLSLQSHNFDMGRTFTGYSRECNDPDPTKGEIDAISFRYMGQTYLGFEDRGGDKDMNDIVFFVTGNAKPKEPVIEVGPTIETEEWLIACEDLGSTDDYDFNDIVFSISHVAGQTSMTITPLAAGGTLRAEVMFNESPIRGSADASEIHYLINKTTQPQNGLYPMLNTTSTVTPGESFTLTVDEDFSIANNLNQFTINVVGKDDSYVITAPDEGTAPQILCLPGTWLWPIERNDITEVYPEFKNWNSQSTSLDWLKTYNKAYVIKR